MRESLHRSPGGLPSQDATVSRGHAEIAEILPTTDSRGETWTHYFRKEETYTHVDHVLVSGGLKSAVENGAARIYDAAGTAEASDHRPVTVKLQWARQ